MTDMTPKSTPQTDAPQPRIPLGALLFAAFLAVAMGAYAFWILDTARRVTDWLLIAPVAAIGIMCLAAAALDDWRQGRLGRDPAEAHGDGRIGAALVVIVLGYAASIPWIGFDIGTAIFVALTLILQGERRAQVVVPMSLMTAGLLVWIFRHLMGVPLPSTLI
jgi:putative tricarboxylic transport membrane protein